MNKSINISTRNEKVKAMIRSGATWEDIEKEFGVTRAWIQICLKESYTNQTAYNNLLAKARENQKEKDKNTVVVVETGVLINHFEEVKKLARRMAVYSHQLCQIEIKKIPNVSDEVKKKLLSWEKLIWVPRDGRENLVVIPKTDERVKPRVFGIVSLCCNLRKTGKQVITFTTSRHIASFSEAQGLGIKVIKY